MGFVQVHLIPHVRQQGFTDVTDASAQFVLALGSIVGALLAGSVSDRVGRRWPMGMTCAWQGLASLALFLLWVWHTPFALYAAVILLGLSWTSIVSLLATTCADLYGRRSQGPVLGVAFGVMDGAMPLGAQVPGLLYDQTATCQRALLLNVLVAWAASGLVFGLREWWRQLQRVSHPARTALD